MPSMFFCVMQRLYFLDHQTEMCYHTGYSVLPGDFPWCNMLCSMHMLQASSVHPTLSGVKLAVARVVGQSWVVM
jgi:hypothetical protein